MDMPKQYVVGVIGNVDYAAPFQAAKAHRTIELIFDQIPDLLAVSRAADTEVVVVSGAEDHPLSKLVYEMAEERGWSHRVGTDWARPGSAFHQECSLVLQIGNDQGSWCEEQQTAMAPNGRGAMFMICSIP